MKSVFDSYPEIILVDTTYKLNNLRMPLYLMMFIKEACNKLGEITCSSSFKSTPEISQGSENGSTASNTHILSWYGRPS